MCTSNGEISDAAKTTFGVVHTQTDTGRCALKCHSGVGYCYKKRGGGKQSTNCCHSLSTTAKNSAGAGASLISKINSFGHGKLRIINGPILLMKVVCASSLFSCLFSLCFFVFFLFCLSPVSAADGVAKLAGHGEWDGRESRATNNSNNNKKEKKSGQLLPRIQLETDTAATLNHRPPLLQPSFFYF